MSLTVSYCCLGFFFPNSLFPGMQTHNLELKKLVYLYVMNYAKSQPDRAILAVNTFHKDASDPNPLIRALAVRTMGCIRVTQITEYLTQPLTLCLKDQDPYVRKTAAVAVAKLYDINPEAVISQGFLDILRELLADSNPMVVSNAVAALSEISEASKEEVFKVDGAILAKLLAALNECTEWGQVFILDSLAKYKPRDTRDAEAICERVSIRFNHSNSAVVLSAVKVVMLTLPFITNADLVKTYIRKLSPPLITLLSSGKEPEIQYVALRNINLVVQRQPEILQGEIKIFFCKYNDPIYVKLEKLELMIMLATEKNIETVLSEFKEYATMVDVEFVRKSVRAIGRCAIKLEAAAERCIQVLLELIQTKVNYVVQEAVIVIKDIFRKYPNKYESIIATLCENLETLDEPEAKASMVWIIGEYADRIENAAELLDRFLEGFADESAQVQLQLLTAVVKLFLKKPKDTEEMVKRVLAKATQEADNPDLRDRGFMYWRLLSANPEAAKGVVLGERPLIKDKSSALDDELLQLLISNIGTLSSVFHKPPAAFVSRVRPGAQQQQRVRLGHDLDDEEEEAGERTPSPPPQQAAGASAPAQGTAPAAPATGQKSIIDLDFLGGTPAPAAPAAAPASSAAALDVLLGVPAVPAAAAVRPAAPAVPDLFGSIPAMPVAPAAAVVQKELLLPAEKGAGMELRGTFVRQNRQLFMDLTCTNKGPAALSQFAMQFNKNSFNLAPAVQPAFGVIAPGMSADALVLLSNQGPLSPPPVSPVIQVAIKNSTGQIFYFTANLPAHLSFIDAPGLDKNTYLAMWRQIPEATEHVINLPLRRVPDANSASAALSSNFIFETARRQAGAEEVIYAAGKLMSGATALVEITVNAAARSFKVATRSSEVSLVPIAEQALQSLL